MSFPLYFRTPDGVIAEVAVEATTTVAQAAELICNCNRLLPRGHVGLFHQGVKLNPASSVSEYNLKPAVISAGGDVKQASAVLTVIVLFGKTPMSKEDCTYDDFIDATFPKSGDKDIPLNIQPFIKFKKNSSGQLIFLPSLSDIAALSTPNDGDMREFLGEELSASIGFTKWTEMAYPQRMFLLEVSKESVVHDLKKIKYSSFTTNAGYTNGDRHSWQRYTSVSPIDAYVHINEVENTARLLPTEALKPSTVYAVVLLNGVPTVPSDFTSMSQPLFSYWRPGICEDMIIIFKTKKPRVFKAPVVEKDNSEAVGSPSVDGGEGQREGTSSISPISTSSEKQKEEQEDNLQS